jgi:hypothetical protein
MQYQSVRAVASRLKSQFKVDMDIFECIQACADALKKMGYIALKRSCYQATVQNFGVNLPGTVWKVRGVIRLDINTEAVGVTIVPQDIYFPPQLIFSFEEPTETPNDVILLKGNYVPQFKGPYIPYLWDSPYLKFNENDIPVAVEVTELAKDEEGFPMVPEPAFFGCLYYSLFVHYQPLALLGQIPLQLMQQVETWKNTNIAQSNSSMMMEALSVNERDNLFEIMTSMDRKHFGLPS